MTQAAPQPSAAPGRSVPFPPEQSSLLYTLLHYPRGPLERFTDLERRYGGVVGYRFLGHTVVAVFDSDVIEQILVTQHAAFVKDRFTSQLNEVLGEGLLTAKGEQHRRLRKLTAPAFTAHEVANYAQTMHASANEFAAQLQPNSTVDVQSLAMHVTLDVLARAIFGQSFEEVELVDSQMAVLMHAFQPWRSLLRMTLPPWFPVRSRKTVQQATEVLRGVAQRLITRKRSQPPGEDLLSRLIREQQDGERLSDLELRDQVLTLLLAGHETTALSLTFTLWLLAGAPEWQQRVEREIDALVVSGKPVDATQLGSLKNTLAVFQEALRLYPPAWTVGRTPLADCTVAGYDFKVGQQILMPMYAVQRSAAYHEAPESFRPERFLSGGAIFEKRVPRFAYSPFGGGPRVCVGSHFAVLEALAILCALLARHRFERVQGEALEVVPSITLRPAKPVMMRVLAREPS